MNILSKLRSLIPTQSKQAALLEEPKLKVPTGAQKSLPKYLGSARNSAIPNSGTDTTSVDRTIFARSAGSLNKVIANLVKVSPDLSQAVATKITSGISESYTIIAYSEDGLVDENGTRMAQALALKMDCQAPDYSRFQRSTDLRSVSASLLSDLLRYGSMGAELVLSKGRQPSHINPFSTSDIKWADDTDSSYIIYSTKEGPIPLNYPTIFYSASVQDNETPYSDSPLQSAIQACLFDAEFFDSLRKAAIKTLLPRLVVTINSEKWLQGLPLEVQSDQTKLQEYITSTVSQVEEQMNGLNPEDALVLFDTLQASDIQNSNNSSDRGIEVLKDLIAGQISSGSKVLPSILGRASSSSAASSEAMLYVKSVAAIQLELNAFYSRIFTLAVRLFGMPVNVKFVYEPVNLRPALELEGFKVTKQSRIMDQLSIGLITDVEASILLTGSLPPAGYVNVSGTQFKTGAIPVTGNDYSNTSVGPTDKTDSNQTVKNNTPETSPNAPGRNHKK